MTLLRRAAALAVLAVGGSLLAGCAGVESALPAGVSVTIQQNRDDYGPRRMEIRIVNDSDRAFDVFEARLSSDAFVADATTDEPVAVPAGVTTALRVQLAESACDSAAPSTSVRVAFSSAGRSGVATVTPDDPFDSIERIATQDCLSTRVARIVDIRADAALRVEGSGSSAVARLDLVFTPTGAAGVVTVDSIGRTILLRPASDAPDWPVQASLDASSGARTISLDIAPNNCNTHTVSEDKRGTFFPVSVITGTGETGVVFVPVSNQIRGEIYAFIAHDFCRWS